jgi:hypothetical protein
MSYGPISARQALSKTSIPVSKQIIACVKLVESNGIKIQPPSTFKLAPLASYEVIFEMPYLDKNDLLIDPVAWKLLSRSCDLHNYIKVGNALMELPAPEACPEEVNSLVEESFPLHI